MLKLKMKLAVTIVSAFILSAFCFIYIAHAAKLSDYPYTATLSQSDTFPIFNTSVNKNVNWQNLEILMTAGINWSALPAAIQNSNINWTSVQLAQKTSTGVNWQYLDIGSGGVNWAVVANGATSATITCWKANNQLGKCTTGITGVACTSCL